MSTHQTVAEQLALDRLARQHERHLKFLRHSPREERWIPFVRDERERIEIADAVIGAAAFFGFVAALIALPALMG
jgi:hypothetical protein